MNIQEMITRTVELELLELKRANGAVIEYKESGKWNEEGTSVRLVSELQYRIQQPPQPEGYEWCGYDVPCFANCDAWLEEVFGTLKIFSFEQGHKPNMHNNGYRHLLQSLPESKVICGSASTCPYAKNNGCQHATPHYDSDDVCLCGCSKIDGIRGATCVPYVEPVMMICDHAETCGAPRGYCKHAEPHACKGEEAYFRCMGSCGEPTKCIPCVEPKHPEFVPYTLDTFDYKFTHLQQKNSPVIRLLPVLEIRRSGIFVEGLFETWQKLHNEYTWPDGSPFGVEVN